MSEADDVADDEALALSPGVALITASACGADGVAGAGVLLADTAAVRAGCGAGATAVGVTTAGVPAAGLTGAAETDGGAAAGGIDGGESSRAFATTATDPRCGLVGATTVSVMSTMPEVSLAPRPAAAGFGAGWTAAGLRPGWGVPPVLLSPASEDGAARSA
jgi:hypothetical protein